MLVNIIIYIYIIVHYYAVMMTTWILVEVFNEHIKTSNVSSLNINHSHLKSYCITSYSSSTQLTYTVMMTKEE